MENLAQEMATMDIQEEKSTEVIECHARIVAFFAHKGGVSKTTNVYHLGYCMAKQHRLKVLLVDADPQQNLTQTICKQAKNDATWRDDVDRGTIYTAMERLHYGLKDGDFIEPAHCVRVARRAIGDDGAGELYLLPGSLDLAKLEPQITFAHNITNPSVFPLFEDIAGGFRALFLATCASLAIDVCLVDMGPSIGELNKSLFWASDYFVIPCSPDSYCKTTMKTMERTLPLWAQQQESLAKVTADQVMPLNPEPPKFLGMIMGLFNVTGKTRKPVKDSQHWMDIIKQVVREELIPALEQVGMVHPYAPDDYTLASIPHFLSLMPIAQKAHAPVYDIPDSGMVVHNDEGDILPMSKPEVKRHRERASVFFGLYNQLAQDILGMFAQEVQEERQRDGQDGL